MSQFKLKHESGKVATIHNKSQYGSNKILDIHDITFAVDTIEDMMNLTDARDGSVCIVRDENRGGTFVFGDITTDAKLTIGGDGGVNFTTDNVAYKGWKRQYSGAVNVKWFIKPSDISCDIGIQQAINCFKNIVFTEIYQINNPIIITKVGFTIKGINGGVSGNYIQVGIDDGVPINYDFIIDGLTIEHQFSGDLIYDEILNNDGIKLINARKGRIINCKFKHCDSGISIKSNSETQHVSRILISNNIFHHCNYCLFTNRDVNQTFGTGDIHFINNQADEAMQKTHLMLHGVDGAVISNNTLFFPSYQLHHQTKEYNIFLDSTHFVIISNNNLFESGYQAIDCRFTQNTIISNNNIAWSGQRFPCSAIRFRDGDISGKVSSVSSPYCLSSVSNNTIISPSYNGIETYSDSGHIKISDNNIRDVGSSSYYYGTDSLNSVNYAVKTLGEHTYTTGNISDADYRVENITAGSTLNNNIGLQSTIIEANRTKNVTSITNNTINVDGFETININLNDSAELHYLESTVYNNGGNIKTLVAFTTKCLIKHNIGNILLTNGMDLLLNTNDTITFKFLTGKWREVSRSARNANTITYTGTETSFDVSNGIDKINIAQSSATTVTEILNGVDRQIIDILAYNSNTTIENNSSIVLKGGSNKTIPSGEILTLKMLGGSWREV